MAETVRLMCVQKKPFQIELIHEKWCVPLGKCECTARGRTTSTHDPQTGVVEKIRDTIEVPGTLTIRPGRDGVVTLPAIVLDLPGVRRALRGDPKAKTKPRLRLL